MRTAAVAAGLLALAVIGGKCTASYDRTHRQPNTSSASEIVAERSSGEAFVHPSRRRLPQETDKPHQWSLVVRDAEGVHLSNIPIEIRCTDDHSTTKRRSLLRVRSGEDGRVDGQTLLLALQKTAEEGELYAWPDCPIISRPEVRLMKGKEVNLTMPIFIGLSLNVKDDRGQPFQEPLDFSIRYQTSQSEQEFWRIRGASQPMFLPVGLSLDLTIYATPTDRSHRTAIANLQSPEDGNTALSVEMILGDALPTLLMPVAMEVGVLKSEDALRVSMASTSEYPPQFGGRLQGLPDVSVVDGVISLPIDAPKDSTAVLYRFEHYLTKQSGTIVIELPLPAGSDYPHPLLTLASAEPVGSGIVRDQDSGRPVEAAQIWLIPSTPDRERLHATSDKSGEFTLYGDRVTGSYELRTSHPNYQAASTVLEAPIAEPLTVVLGHGIPVSGRVLVDDPALLGYLYVRTRQVEMESTADLVSSEFSLPGYSSDKGTVDVAIVIEFCEYVVFEVSNWMPDDTSQVVCDLRGRLMNIEQIVVAANGSSLAEQWVEIRGSLGFSGEVQVDNEGYIRFPVPNTTEWLTVGLQGHSPVFMPMTSSTDPVHLP